MDAPRRAPDRATIFARSSGAGVAGVAVYRVSGPKAGEVLDSFCRGRGQPRRARLVDLQLPDGSLLDQGIALWFPGPSSFTGEDVAELHLHGSIAVDRAFTEAMLSFGLAPASAGEFTLRAFEAGKLDLTQAEGLSDLLTAETEAQRRQALGQLGSRLSALAEGWRRQLVEALAALEAAVDFPDEEDVPVLVASRSKPILDAVAGQMREALRGAGAAQATRRGVTVAITGPPNAGKSSLLNRLAGEERAIVSAAPGTTRDAVEAVIELAGQRVTVIDTAGLREAADEVEAEGVRRAERIAEEADVVVAMVNVNDLVDAEGGAEAPGPTTLRVANKVDEGTYPGDGWLGVSMLTGEGVEDLLDALAGLVARRAGAGVLTRQRHADLVARAAGSIEIAAQEVDHLELSAEETRLAVRFMEELIGRVSPDEVLDSVFSAFCIGK